MGKNQILIKIIRNPNSKKLNSITLTLATIIENHNTKN